MGDVVNANILAAQTPSLSWGEVFNIGTGRNYSINEIASFMGGETVNIPPRSAEARMSLADPSKANTYLGWIPQVRLEDWIAEHK